MTRNDIDRIYTEQVAGLLAKGFRIHTNTMSGSQGEIAHIDLTDGSEMLRVLIENWNTYGEYYDDNITIKVGRCTEPLKGHGRNIIWNDRLEIISQIEIAKITNSFYTTLEESKRMYEKRREHRRNRREPLRKDLSRAYKSAALTWLRKQPRMKSCRLEDIEWMTRSTLENGRVCYAIRAKGKTYLLHA